MNPAIRCLEATIRANQLKQLSVPPEIFALLVKEYWPRKYWIVRGPITGNVHAVLIDGYCRVTPKGSQND
jgi:hypothetical protein